MDNPVSPSEQELQEVASSATFKRPNPNRYDTKTVLKHLGLFVLTFISVSFTGGMFVGHTVGVDSVWPLFWDGTLFAALLLGFLGVHEFGHFFAAIYHRIKVTLPYFIPIPIGIGTLGAVIRIKQKINESHKMFDVGVAGPLAGFIASLAILLYGFSTLPDPSYINNFEGHEAIQEYVAEQGVWPEEYPGETNGEVLIVGNTLLYDFLGQFFDNVPPMYEMYHFPFLFAGWLGLFFTALNLMPVGQLDGGHILYSLIGYRKHRTVARLFFGALTVLAGVESIPLIHQSLESMLSMEDPNGAVSWLFWAGVLFFLLRKAFHGDHRWIAPLMLGSMALTAIILFLVIGSLEENSSLIWLVWSFFTAYFVGIEHPPALYEKPLDSTRKILGWSSMAIFVLCISPNPLYFI